MGSKKKPEHRDRVGDSEIQYNPGVKDTARSGENPARESHDDQAQTLGDLVASLVRFQGSVLRLHEEAHREQSELAFPHDFDPDREIQELRRSDRSIAKTLALLQNLRKVQKIRIRDLVWMRDELGLGRRRRAR